MGIFFAFSLNIKFCKLSDKLINKAIIELESLEKMRFAHSTLLQNIVLRVLVNVCFL